MSINHMKELNNSINEIAKQETIEDAVYYIENALYHLEKLKEELEKR